GFGGKLTIDGGLVFGSSGGIINPSTTPPSQVAVLPIVNGSIYPYNVYGGVVPYQVESKAFTIASSNSGYPAAYYLERFDTQHFTLEQQIQLPGNPGSALAGLRFGQDGLAYVVPNASNSQIPQIFLLRGPFVLPAEAVANSAPTLSSVQSTISAGTGNLYLTVSGTGFLPGAVALWNGSPRTTTFVDNTHLQVAIPAADLASAQTVTLKSQNPGSGNSNGLTIT